MDELPIFHWVTTEWPSPRRSLALKISPSGSKHPTPAFPGMYWHTGAAEAAPALNTVYVAMAPMAAAIDRKFIFPLYSLEVEVYRLRLTQAQNLFRGPVRSSSHSRQVTGVQISQALFCCASSVGRSWLPVLSI